MRLLGGESGVSGCDIEGRDEDDVEDVEDRLFDFVDDNMEARAALLMGTWIPRLGSDNDLRRVLYGIVRTRRTKCLDRKRNDGDYGSWGSCVMLLMRRHVLGTYGDVRLDR